MDLVCFLLYVSGVLYYWWQEPTLYFVSSFLYFLFLSGDGKGYIMSTSSSKYKKTRSWSSVFRKAAVWDSLNLSALTRWPIMNFGGVGRGTRSLLQCLQYLKQCFFCSNTQQQSYNLCTYITVRRSQWPSGLRPGSAAGRLLGSRVRIPPRAWIVSVV